MRKLLRLLYNLLVLALVAAIVFLNYKLYHIPEYVKEDGITLNKETLDQLRYLKEGLRKGSADEMQAQFPEGFVFTYALYGLSWCAFAEDAPPKSAIKAEAIAEARMALEQIFSVRGKAHFQPELQPPYGIFYAGWANFLQAEIIKLEGLGAIDAGFEEQFLKNSRVIAAAFDGTAATYLPSYKGAAWPADNMVAMASLKTHGGFYGNDYAPTIENWLKKVKANLDPVTGLIPHEAGRNTQPRGSSQSLMLNLLPSLDEAFALDQFKRYRQNFLTYRFGLPAIREYVEGQKSEEDFDSGPILLKVGGSASVIGIGAMRNFGERDLAKGLTNAIEAFGFSVTEDGKKRYLDGRLAILDASVVFSQTRKAHFAIEREDYDFQLGRLRFHGWSIALILILLLSKRVLRAFGRFLDKRYNRKKAIKKEAKNCKNKQIHSTNKSSQNKPKN